MTRIKNYHNQQLKLKGNYLDANNKNSISIVHITAYVHSKRRSYGQR